MSLRTRILDFFVGLIPRPPAPPAPPSPPGPSFLADLLDAHNRERVAVRAGPLTLDLDLCRLAQGHSADQAAHSNMSHTGSDGASPFARLDRAGYPYTTAGENVAMGYPSVATVMAGWMNSPGHKANVLRPTFTHVGFGEAADARGRFYWTALFATPAVRAAEAPTVLAAVLSAGCPGLVPPPLEGLTREVMAALDERLAAGRTDEV